MTYTATIRRNGLTRVEIHAPSIGEAEQQAAQLGEVVMIESNCELRGPLRPQAWSRHRAMNELI